MFHTTNAALSALLPRGECGFDARWQCNNAAKTAIEAATPKFKHKELTHLQGGRTDVCTDDGQMNCNVTHDQL